MGNGRTMRVTLPCDLISPLGGGEVGPSGNMTVYCFVMVSFLDQPEIADSRCITVYTEML